MENDILKYKIIAVLVGILGGTQSLSAQEAKILTNVYSTMPKVTNLRDKDEIARFIDQNFGKLSQDTIRTLNSLIESDRNLVQLGSKTVNCHHPENANLSANDYEENLSKAVMCMVD